MNSSKIPQFFNNTEKDPRFIGVYPMGTGDPIEIPYRHHWELFNFLEIIKNRNNVSILELGCGAGRWAISLSPVFKKYVGVDLSALQLNYARKVIADMAISNVTFVKSSICDYQPELNETFDVIYFSGVLQYLEDEEIRQILQNCQKWLTKYGVIVDRSTIVYENKRIVRNDEQYYCIYRLKKEHIKMFNDCGFQNTFSGRSYQYLCFARFWKMLSSFNVDNKTFNISNKQIFTIMKNVSFIFEKLFGKLGKEKDGILYSHEFFLFEKREI